MRSMETYPHLDRAELFYVSLAARKSCATSPLESFVTASEQGALMRQRVRNLAFLAVIASLGGACRDFDCPPGYKAAGERCLVNPDDPAAPKQPPAFSATSGGGSAKSDRYAVRISVGAPGAMGNAQSDTYRLQAGPQP
jgi:hypothetical protein